MRIDPDTCRDPDLLAAEVRRLRNVLAADDPWITDAEREAVAWACAALSVNAFILTDDAQTSERHAAILRGLFDRTN